MVVSENSAKKIIPVAGGKGGVGKSILTVNLGLHLAQAGKKTVLVDLDMGAANLHTCLGIKNNRPGIGNFVSGGGMGFADIVSDTVYSNLFFVPGDVLVPGMADIPAGQKKALLGRIGRLEADYVFLDLGAGSHFSVIDFFLVSNSGLLVTTPQVTSLLNTFSFLKNLVFRFLQGALPAVPVRDYLKRAAKEVKPNSRFRIGKILKDIEAIDEASAKMARAFIKILRPHLVITMVSSPDELAMIYNLRRLVKESLEIDLGCLGVVFDDPSVDSAMKELTPLALYAPGSLAARQLARAGEKILQSPRFPDMPLHRKLYKDSFELAAIEAENDFAGK